METKKECGLWQGYFQLLTSYYKQYNTTINAYIHSHNDGTNL
jgi:hypothetical protein